MKNILAILMVALVAPGTLAQGLVLFDTSVGVLVDRPVRTISGPISGNDWTAQLYGGTAAQAGSGALVPLFPVTTFFSQRISRGEEPGYVLPVTVAIPGVAAGEEAVVELRVYPSSYGSFEAAPEVDRDRGRPVHLVAGGGELPPALLLGFESLEVVPEPTVATLAAFAIFGLLAHCGLSRPNRT